MKKLVLATIAAGTLLSAPALAADMAVKARPPVLSPAFNWSGFYIGGDLGWQGSRMDLSDPIGGTLTYSPTHNGFAGGGFAGIQQQFGQFVLGVEGGYLAGTGRDNFSTPASVNIFIPGGTGAAEVRLRDIWSIGARAGLPMGMWMPYVTGGYGNGQFEFSAVSVPADAFTQQAKTNNGGGYVGAGIDYALANNWILGAEYRHYFFDARTSADTVTGVFVPFPATTINPRTDTVLARLSYKFNFMH